jgi:monofunctional biosynthetic peptidoglycan transglycosylase
MMMRIFQFIRALIITLPLAFFSFHAIFFCTIGIQIIKLRDSNPPATSLMRLRDEGASRVDQPPSFTPLSAVPADLVRTVLFAEDGYFFHHYGISLRYIRHALELNQRLGYTAYGASTITQQLARTLYLSPEKSYIRKYFEVLISLELEIMLEKDRILELYLNYIELGDHIYGFSDAAQYYFHKPLSKLNAEEKLMLITIMPNPRLYSPFSFMESELLTRRYSFIERYYRIEQSLPPRFDSTIIEQ